MRIAVDGQLMVGNRTGMGMYAYNILKYWNENEDEIIIYVPEPFPNNYQKLLDKKGFRVCVLGKGNYFKWEQMLLPRAIKEEKVDVLWCPYITAPIFSPCPISVVIHDTIYNEVKIRNAPTLYKKMGLIYRRIVAPIAAKKAVTVATVSEFAREEVCRYFPVVRNKIEVIYSGIEAMEGLDEKEQRDYFKKNNIDQKYILGFGSLEARKNSMMLIKAYEKLSEQIRREYKLVLFGFRGYEKSQDKVYIEAHNLEKEIISLGYVSDKEKKSLYKMCSVFVFPSLAEGFGLPVIEAFEAEVPVVTSNTTSLPEVAGTGAILVDPSNVLSIKSGIERVLKDPQLAESLVKNGKSQLDKYSWKLSSEKIQKLIHSRM